ITAEQIAPWYDVAARYFDAGPAQFTSPLDGLAAAGNCRLDRLERWSEARDLRRLHAKKLFEDPGLRIHLGAVATGIDIDPATGCADRLVVATRSGTPVRLRASAFILACGGLETARLLLASRRDMPLLFGGGAGPLG